MFDKKSFRVSHIVFTDNCYLSAETKEQLSKMIIDATEELRMGVLDWREDQMEMISWGLQGKSWRSAY